MKFFLCLTFIVCTHLPSFAQQARVQHSLKTDIESYDVKGRNALFWKRQISYGEFSTSKVKGGWRSYQEFPFLFTFRRIKQRFSYVQYGPNGLKAEYAGVYIHKQTDLPLIGHHFHIPIKYEQYLAGHVYVTNTLKAYEFLLNYPSINTRITPTEGRIFSKDGSTIEIRGLQRMEGMNFNLPANLGYEFLIDGEVVAAVDGMVRGKVHFSRKLTDEQKTVLAAIMNALLLHNP